MKKKNLLWITIALLLVLIAAGCGGGGNGAGQSPVTGSEGGAPGAASPVDAATAATITGKVNFTGTAPAPEPILMDAEQVCLDKHAGGVTTEAVVVNSNNTLKNVFVYVKDGLGEMEFPVPQEPVVLDQNGCVYTPHVFGVQVNQEMIIRNSDGILHNIHPMPEVNRPYNLGQPVVMDSTKKFDKAEMYIPIGCDVHDWMLAYVSVLDHPYFSTSGDDGTFSLPNLPPGTYTVVAWHETYGEQEMSVTVGDSETKDIEFSFAGN